MRIVTWNVNSIRIRLPRLLSFLERDRPDVLCLQETKVVDADFPADAIRAAGYNFVCRGQKTYNGVAILSLHPLEEVVRQFPDDAPEADCRFLGALVGGVRVLNLYVPNGSEVGSEKYAYKLLWLERLRRLLDLSFDPASDLLLCGDFNVAPDDRDVWDPEQWRDQILCSEPERAALRRIMDWGLVDALRIHQSGGGIYTWWDYRGGAFHRGWGLRIDHFLITASLARRCASVTVLRDERKGEKPSDHAPVAAVV